VVKPQNIFIYLLFFILSSSIAFAQDDLIINADSISYEKDIIRADGSVEATFKDIKILGQRLVYNVAKRSVLLDSGFTFFYGDVIISGRVIEYELDSDKGRGSFVDINYENVHLEGKKLDFDREEIKLKNASFNTCGIKPDPHYRVSAGQMSLYPKTNWLVAFWGIFWLDNIPTLPVPVYVYDIEAERKGQHNILPYPEIGSNDDDGLFVNESIIWYASRELSGSVSIKYAEKKSLGGGFEANYIFNQDNQGNLRIYGNPYDSFWGGWTHHYYFGPVLAKKYLPTDILSASTFKQMDLETNLTLREWINYERVSKTPEIFLKFREPNFKIGGGKISENSGEAIAKINAALVLEHVAYRNDGFGIIPSISLDYSRYSKGRYWWKNIGRINLEKKWSDFISTGVGYSHFIDNQGASPFLYEMYRFISSDQIHADLKLNFGKSTFLIEAVHNLPNLDPYDIDYTLEAGIHCYALGFRYRVMRREFNLIFKII